MMLMLPTRYQGSQPSGLGALNKYWYWDLTPDQLRQNLWISGPGHQSVLKAPRVILKCSLVEHHRSGTFPLPCLCLCHPRESSIHASRFSSEVMCVSLPPFSIPAVLSLSPPTALSWWTSRQPVFAFLPHSVGLNSHLSVA